MDESVPMATLQQVYRKVCEKWKYALPEGNLDKVDKKFIEAHTVHQGGNWPIDGYPVLCEDYDMRGYFVISWEEGPYEWALSGLSEGWDAEIASYRDEFPNLNPVIPGVSTPNGVWLEPQNSYTLTIYPDI